MHKCCEHTVVKYCTHCQKCYCVQCDKEWGGSNYWYPGYPYWQGSTTFPFYTTSTDSVTTCGHNYGVAVRQL